MAADVTRDILVLNEGKALTAAYAAAKDTAFTIDARGGDYKTLILFTNKGSATANAVVSIGNGIQGAGEDLTVEVEGSATVGLVVDSGYFKNVSGDNKDFIVVTPSAALSVQAIELPQ